jgi:RNA polymerase sigma-70 factor (ECF subfamily)
MAEFEASEEVVLLRQAASGSREAFAELVRLHQAAVRWFLVRGLRDPAAADDLAQDVFLAAYQNLAKCRNEDGLRAWLLGIARNMARQHVRGESRRRARERGPLAAQMAQWRMERLEQNPDEELEYERKLAALRGCVQRLPPDSRRVVEEHYFQRQSAEAIAKQQGRTAGSVRMLLLRLRKALAECIRKKLEMKTTT